MNLACEHWLSFPYKGSGRCWMDYQERVSYNRRQTLVGLQNNSDDLRRQKLGKVIRGKFRTWGFRDPSELRAIFKTVKQSPEFFSPKSQKYSVRISRWQIIGQKTCSRRLAFFDLAQNPLNTFHHWAETASTFHTLSWRRDATIIKSFVIERATVREDKSSI